MRKLRLRKQLEITATCSACGRVYSCSELHRQLVQEGRLESLCGNCDGSHYDK